MHSACRAVAGPAPVTDRGGASDAEPCAGMLPAVTGVPFRGRLSPKRVGVGSAWPGPEALALRPAPGASPPGPSSSARGSRVRVARPCRCRREGARAARRQQGCSPLREACRPNSPREPRAGPAWLKSPCFQYRDEIAAAQVPSAPRRLLARLWFPPGEPRRRLGAQLFMSRLTSSLTSPSTTPRSSLISCKTARNERR